MPKKSSIQDSASFDLSLKEARAILRAEKQRLRDATRVKLCSAFEKWMELKEKTQMKTHEDVALYLLHIYEKWEKKVELETSQESDLKPIAGWNIPMEKEYDLTRKQSKELQNLGKLAVKFSDISSKLTTLRKDTKSTDIIFIIKDGAEVTAHKTILSLFSKTLQENEVRKCINPILSDATQCGLDGFLDLVYGLGVTLSHENFDDILHVAEVLRADKVIATLKSVQHKITAPKIDERSRTIEENNGFNVKQEIVNEQMDNNALKTTEEMCDNGVIQHETMDVINQENHAASEGYGACKTSNMETEGKFAKLKNENFGAKDDNESVTLEHNEEKSLNELQDETMEIQESETVSTNVNTKAMDGTSVVDIKPNSYDTSNIGDVSKGHEIKTEVIDFNDSAEEYDDEYDDEYDEYNVEEDDSGSDILFTDSGSDFSFQDDKKDLDWSPDFEQTSSSIKTRSKKTAETDIISSNDDTSSDDSGDSDSHTRKHAKKTKTKTNGNKGRSKSKPRKTWREKYIDQAIGEFKCPNCQNILETKFKLREHVEAKHDQFMCPLCDQCFKTNGERDLHRQAHYRFKNSDSSMGDFFCDICDVQFSSKHIYLLHMLQPGHIKKRGSTKLCIQCETWIPNTNFKKHLSSKHDFSVTQCYICKEKLPTRNKRKKQLNSAFEMQRHLYEKHKQRNYNCVFCDHTSFILVYLTSHIVDTHHRLRVRQCKLCTFTYRARHQIQTHVRKAHKLGTSWVCNKCGDTFESFKMKVAHIARMHPTLIPCEYCGKELSRKNMNQHVRVHTGIKPYICEHCGEKFAQKNSLNWHMSSKHSHLDEEKNTSKKLKSTGKRKKSKS